MKTKTSIWPYDILNDPIPPERNDPNHLVCFLICPFSPKEFSDDLYNLVQTICNDLGKQLSCKIEVRRADKIASPGIIHSEIWREIQTSDFIIADVSGLNGNVLIELGVAAACRNKENIIILKQENPDEDFLFDIIPARHIIYNKKSFFCLQDIAIKLKKAIIVALTPAPFNLNFEKIKRDLLDVYFKKGLDVDWLICPSMTHRKLTSEYLEFGSLYIFRYSWLMVKGPEMPKVKIYAKIKFTKTRPNVGALIAISVRKPHFFANFGHTLFVNTDGNIVRTVPKDDLGNYEDQIISPHPNFNLDNFFEFNLEINDKYFSMFVDGIGGKFKVSEMPFVFSGGKILFQTFNAYAGIEKIRIKKI